MKKTDYVAVLTLAKDLLLNIKAIEEEDESIKRKLHSLQSTFLDSGIQEVEGYVDQISKNVKNAKEETQGVVNKLLAYAALLEEGK